MSNDLQESKNFLTIRAVKARAKIGADRLRMSTASALHYEASKELPRYDVFLSQTTKDHDLVYGIYCVLAEDLKLSVFCDWITFGNKERSDITPSQARSIRQAMSRSGAFVFLDSPNSLHSTWMPWELGWFDGTSGRVGVLPILENQTDDYRSREFLGLYPLVETHGKHVLMVRMRQEILEQYAKSGVAYGLATSMPFTAWLTASSAFFNGRWS